MLGNLADKTFLNQNDAYSFLFFTVKPQESFYCLWCHAAYIKLLTVWFEKLDMVMASLHWGDLADAVAFELGQNIPLLFTGVSHMWAVVWHLSVPVDPLLLLLQYSLSPFSPDYSAPLWIWLPIRPCSIIQVFFLTFLLSESWVISFLNLLFIFFGRQKRTEANDVLLLFLMRCGGCIESFAVQLYRNLSLAAEKHAF